MGGWTWVKVGLTGAVSSSVGHLRFRTGRLSNPNVCLTFLDKPEGLAGGPAVPAVGAPQQTRQQPWKPRQAARVWSPLCDRVDVALALGRVAHWGRWWGFLSSVLGLRLATAAQWSGQACWAAGCGREGVAVRAGIGLCGVSRGVEAGWGVARRRLEAQGWTQGLERGAGRAGLGEGGSAHSRRVAGTGLAASCKIWLFAAHVMCSCVLERPCLRAVLCLHCYEAKFADKTP